MDKLDEKDSGKERKNDEEKKPDEGKTDENEEKNKETVKNNLETLITSVPTQTHTHEIIVSTAAIPAVPSVTAVQQKFLPVATNDEKLSQKNRTTIRHEKNLIDTPLSYSLTSPVVLPCCYRMYFPLQQVMKILPIRCLPPCRVSYHMSSHLETLIR